MTPDQAAAHAYHAGRATWPALRMDLSAFQRWIAEAGIDVESLKERGDELYLVAGCVAHDPEAYQAFERRYLATMTQTVGRIVLSADQADELRQQLRVTLLLGTAPKIGTFKGQGPLGAWVQVCAVRLALKLGAARDRLAGPDAGLLEGLVAQDADQELLAAKSQYRDTFQAALEECFSALPSRQKTLLRMHFLDGMSIDEMGQVFHVHRATIARWLVAIRKEVLEQICRKISLNLHTSSSEFRSMVRLVQSDVRLSLHRILGEDPRR
ncbi:MAG TPA: sigma-70 family RNA polymerase sigma factor [Polyangia bacterium]|nr:sigma-70 family RNA polymerase sigma factor [Polyangia bacterium]